MKKMQIWLNGKISLCQGDSRAAMDLVQRSAAGDGETMLMDAQIIHRCNICQLLEDGSLL